MSLVFVFVLVLGVVVCIAPHYLVAEEKVHLCTNAPVTGYNDPIKCLQAVHTYSKNFQNAPKRALGYFQENLQLDSEWTSRALLVSMCSFSDSQDPLAAAECYKSVPTSLQHGKSGWVVAQRLISLEPSHHRSVAVVVFLM
jgi:hypothetical protein